MVVGGVATTVGFVVGVVVLVEEEKIEPDAASIEVGVNKTNATKEACVTIGSGSKEVKDSAEVGGKAKEGVNKIDVEETKKKSEVVGVKAESKQLFRGTV